MDGRFIVSEISQYVVARIQEELFALNIRYVQEILKQPDITKVPTKVPYLLGLIKLRNQAVPLINVRKKFYNTDELVHSPVVIIIQDAHLNKLVGLLVDEVEEIASIPSDSIDHPILFSGRDGEESVSGVANLNSGLVIILNDEKLFSDLDYKAFETITKP